MASYETMPSPSAATETKPNVKRLVICAAALSFALGALAATALSPKDMTTASSFKTKYDEAFIIHGCAQMLGGNTNYHIEYAKGPAGFIAGKLPKVYNECKKGKDKKNHCQQHFYCVKSDTDDLFDDC